MIPHEGARPGSRSGARAATGAAPHWCRGPLVGAAPGLTRDETGSGSWLCRRARIRAAAGPVARAAARRLPGCAGMRHGLKRPGLVLTPDRQPTLGAERVGLLDQLFWPEHQDR